MNSVTRVMNHVVFMVIFCSVWTRAFTNNGITYNILSTASKTVEVTQVTTNNTGNITIPATVSTTISTGTSSETITYSVTAIRSWAFANHTELTSVTIGKNVTSIKEYAFSGCTGLTDIYANPKTPPSLGSNAFTDVPVATCVLHLMKETLTGYAAASGWSAFTNVKTLSDVTVDKIIYSPASSNTFEVGDNTGFSGTTVNIPATVTYNGTDYAVTSIGGSAFEKCTGLTSVTIGQNVTSIGESAFEYCIGLTAITIPDSVTSIGAHAFVRCSKVTSVTIGKNVTSIGEWAFGICSKLTSVTIPASVTTIGVGAFSGCTGLTAITVDEANTAYSSEEGVLFNKDKSTIISYPAAKSETSYTIPESVTTIGDNAFYGTNLTSVTVPDSVTSIGNSAFYYSTSLASVTIPDSVTSIGNYAFTYCTSLTAIYANPVTPPTLGINQVFTDVPDTCVVYVKTVEAKTAYEAADTWKDFSVVVNNKAPVVSSAMKDISVDEDGSISSVTLSKVFSDVDGDALSYTATSSDTSLVKVSASDAGVLSYTLVKNASGKASVVVTASDGNLSVSDTVVVTVNKTDAIAGSVPVLSANGLSAVNRDGVLSLNYTTSRTANVTITLYNLSGAQVLTLHEGMRNAGDYESLATASLQSGLYIGVLSLDGSVAAHSQIAVRR